MKLRPARLAAFGTSLAIQCCAQVAILQIRVIEGEGAVHPAGSRLARGLTVEITDETGKPVEDAAVSFHLPDDGPSGVFVNGLRTQVTTTDAAGRAEMRGLVLNRIPGPFQIRVVASKEQARAGLISEQYIGEGRGGAAAPAAPAQTRSQGASHHRLRWVLVAVLAGGGAAAGVISATRSGGAAASPAPPPLSIGLPTTTVVKP